MNNIMIHGISGAMGQFVYELVKDHNVIGFDHKPFHHVKTYTDYDIDEVIDVIIDFSHHSMVDPLIDFAVERGIPVIICTTGLSEETMTHIEAASSTIPVFQSGNMSLGINVLIELAKIGAKSLSGFDIEILEKHHNKKIDAPSGTAYMIAEALQTIKDYELVFGRQGNEALRKEHSIGIHAIRGGSITGEHTVMYAGLDETIEIIHQATSKRVFAKGAVKAAEFIINKQPGLYNMGHMLGGHQ